MRENGGKKKMEAGVCWKSRKERKKMTEKSWGDGPPGCSLEVGGSHKNWKKKNLGGVPTLLE